MESLSLDVQAPAQLVEISTLVIQTGTEYMPSVDKSNTLLKTMDLPLLGDRCLANLRTRAFSKRSRDAGRTARDCRLRSPTPTGYGVDNIILDNTKGYDFPVM